MKLAQHINHNASLYLTQRLHSEIDKSQQLSCSSVLEHNTSNYKSDLCPFFPPQAPTECYSAPRRKTPAMADKKHFPANTHVHRR